MVAETAGASNAATPSLVIEYSLNGGAYALVTGATPIQFAAFIGATDGDATTQQIGAGSFVAGELDSNGTVAANAGLVNQETEMEYCLFIDSAQVSDGDTIALRAYDAGSALNGYTNTPVITVVETAPPITGTGAGTIGAATGTGDGTVVTTITGTGAGTIGAVTGTGVGTDNKTVTGTGAGTIGAVTGAGTGTKVTTITGTGAATIGAATGAGTGTREVTGSGAVTIGAITGTGAGADNKTVTGSGAVTIGAIIGEGTGTADTIAKALQGESSSTTIAASRQATAAIGLTQNASQTGELTRTSGEAVTTLNASRGLDNTRTGTG